MGGHKEEEQEGHSGDNTDRLEAPGEMQDTVWTHKGDPQKETRRLYVHQDS